MAYLISPVAQGQLFNNQGKPLAGGKVFAYVGGSFSTLQSTYTDSTGATANPNPLTLDASGRAPAMFLDTNNTYNIVVTAPDGTTVLQTFQFVSPDFADVMFKTGGNALTGAQTVAFVTLTPGATINTDARLSNNFVVTLNQNSTLANPTNLRDGGIYAWVVVTGGFTLAYGNKFRWANGTVPTVAGTSLVVGQYVAATDIILATAGLSYA
jgi:hypothetical protein